MEAHKTTQIQDPHQEHIPVSTLAWIFVILLALLGLTVWIAHYNFGRLNLVAAMMIATLKAVLVVLYFMQAKRSIKMIKIYASAAVIWLAIGLILVFCDYLTRIPVQ